MVLSPSVADWDTDGLGQYLRESSTSRFPWFGDSTGDVRTQKRDLLQVAGRQDNVIDVTKLHTTSSTTISSSETPSFPTVRTTGFRCYRLVGFDERCPLQVVSQVMLLAAFCKNGIPFDCYASPTTVVRSVLRSGR